MLLQHLTRCQLEEIAPTGTVVLPTASMEQHGPHLPIAVDTMLCTHVAQQAVAAAAPNLTTGAICLAPTHIWGNSHHHRPFPGVLSLSSDHYMASVTDILEGLWQSGFRRIFILNGHGGNTAPNAIIAQDFVHRRGFPAHVTAADYWNIARRALVDAGLICNGRIPGHAGEFETALMRAVHPEALSEAGLQQVRNHPELGTPRYGPLPTTVQSRGAWAAQGGYSDEPDKGTAAQGQAMLQVIVSEVVKALQAFHTLPAVD